MLRALGVLFIIGCCFFAGIVGLTGAYFVLRTDWAQELLAGKPAGHAREAPADAGEPAANDSAQGQDPSSSSPRHLPRVALPRELEAPLSDNVGNGGIFSPSGQAETAYLADAGQRAQVRPAGHLLLAPAALAFENEDTDSPPPPASRIKSIKIGSVTWQADASKTLPGVIYSREGGQVEVELERVSLDAYPDAVENQNIDGLGSVALSNDDKTLTLTIAPPPPPQYRFQHDHLDRAARPGLHDSIHPTSVAGHHWLVAFPAPARDKVFD